MKALITSILFTFSFGLSQAQAATTCYVYLTSPCLVNRMLPPSTAFADGDGLANGNAARCLERAQEYKNYCRTPGLEAHTIFSVDGRNVIGAHTATDGKTYISNGLGRMTSFRN